MFENKEVVEQARQNAQDSIELVQALGAAVQDSMLRMGQLNREFFEGLAAVKAPTELLGAQADYLQKCGQVAQYTVLNLAKLSCEGALDYWGRFNTETAAAASQTVEPAPTPVEEAEFKAGAEPVAEKEPKPEPKPDVKVETEVVAKAESKPESQPKTPAQKAAPKPRRPRRTTNKMAAPKKATSARKAGTVPKAGSSAKATADPVPTLTKVAGPAKPVQTPAAAVKPADITAPKASTEAKDVPAAAASGRETKG